MCFTLSLHKKYSLYIFEISCSLFSKLQTPPAWEYLLIWIHLKYQKHPYKRRLEIYSFASFVLLKNVDLSTWKLVSINIVIFQKMSLNIFSC